MSTPNLHPIQRETFSLTSALPTVALGYTAEFVRVLSCDEDFEFSVNRSGTRAPIDVNGLFRMPLDENGRPTSFDNIAFHRKTGAAVATNNIEIVVGSGVYETNTFLLSASVSVTADQTIRQTAASGITVVGDKAPVATGGANATQLCAANTSRRCVTVDNTSGTIPLRICGTEANAILGRGFYLPVGASKEIYNTSALWAAGVGGVGACAVTEETW